MHSLINDIERYPEFVPGCSSARILERHPDALVARLEVGRGPLRTAFTTRNRSVGADRVTMELVEGPLRSLDGVWTLTPIAMPVGQAPGCRVTLDLRFELSAGLASLALGSLIERTAASLVDAFVRRARGG